MVESDKERQTTEQGSKGPVVYCVTFDKSKLSYKANSVVTVAKIKQQIILTAEPLSADLASYRHELSVSYVVTVAASVVNPCDHVGPWT